MKKTLITLLVTLLMPFATMAQHKLVIHYSDGTTFEKNVWDVESVTFEDIAPKALPVGALTPTAVDLGLPSGIKWADVNLGATASDPVGFLVGWGDVSSLNVSTNLKWYPVENPVGDITDTANDIIRSYWGDKTEKWRMPTDEELQELLDECTWTWNGERGGFVVSKNDAEIFLPLTGVRNGETVSNATTMLNYWSGTLNTADNTTAKALSYNSESNAVKPTLTDLKRYMGCALRPVSGDGQLNISIEAVAETNEMGVAGMTTAAVNIQMGGSFAAYSDLTYGLYYSTSNDLANNLENESLVKKVTTTTPLTSSGTHTFSLTGLTADVTYYYLPFVIVKNKQIFGLEGKSFFTSSFVEPEYVDMGLSVKWATFNVGATQPSEYGNYIGWGDATGKLTSSNGNDYAVGNTSAYIGGDKRYDVAQAKWGKKWRMPKQSEFEELFDETKCTVEQVSNCWKITSLRTGKSIILPRCGLINTTGHVDRTSFSWYWTAEADENDPDRCYYMVISGPTVYQLGRGPKQYRMPIRPVYEEATSWTSPTNPGGDNPPVNPVDDNPTTNPDPETPETAEVGQAVDLGLSVKWADRNVGATGVGSYGEYISWGDTEARDNYSLKGYVHYDATGINECKYLGTSATQQGSYHIANTQYDAAHVRWGGTWRLPTERELYELMEQCTWVWSSQGSIPGYRVTSKTNGNSIFLPAAGYKSGTSSTPTNQKKTGYYWCDGVDWRTEGSMNYNGINLEFDQTEPKGNFHARFHGLSIRPVQPK